MKPETLASIKKQIRKFHTLYEQLIEMWNGKLEHGNNATYPHTIQVGVILHNLSYSGINCEDYSHEVAVDEMVNLIDILGKIDEYHHYCYMTHYAWNEVRSIYDGEVMSEDYDLEYEYLEELKRN